MKNIIKIMMVLIVGISGVVNAQNRYYTVRKDITERKFIGGGFYSTDVQGQTDSATIADNCTKALFGPDNVSLSFYRSDMKGLSPVDVRFIQGKWLSKRLDGFHPGQPNDYKLDYEMIDIETPEGKKLWEDNVDGFIEGGKGVNQKIQGCDPTVSSARASDRYWMVLTITKLSNSRTARLLANCGNPIWPKRLGDETLVTQTTTAPVVIYNYNIMKTAPVAKPVYQAPVINTCTISSFKAYPVRLITRNQKEVKLTWDADCHCYMNLTSKVGDNGSVSTLATNLPAFGKNSYTDSPDLTPPIPGAKVWTVNYEVKSCMNVSRTTEVVIDTRTWFGRNKAVWIPTAAAIVIGVAVDIIKHHADSHNNTGWVHDSNTSPWGAGTGSGTGNGPTF